MMYPIAPNGIFWTLQGEGANQGTPMAFVRLAGCSVGCADCDTDYRVEVRLEVADVIQAIKKVIPAAHTWPWVWITGGEPTDHNLVPLIEACHAEGWRVALATAGIRDVPVNLVEWLSVSPHAKKIAMRAGHELKVVPGLNGLTIEDVEELGRNFSGPWKFVQPFWFGKTVTESSLQTCIDFVLTHPGWRLTTQAHKTWNLP